MWCVRVGDGKRDMYKPEKEVLIKEAPILEFIRIQTRFVLPSSTGVKCDIVNGRLVKTTIQGQSKKQEKNKQTNNSGLFVHSYLFLNLAPAAYSCIAI